MKPIFHFLPHVRHCGTMSTAPPSISPLLPMPSILTVGMAWRVFYRSNAAHWLFNGHRSGRFDDAKRGGLFMFGEHSSIFPAPLLFSLPPPSKTYQKDGLYCVFGFVNVVPGCVKANFGSWTAFYGNNCDILLILRNVLGLSAVGRIQESALLDDWLYGGYIEGCVDVVVSNKGANNWGWRCKNTSLKVFVGNPTIFIAINGGIYCWLQSTDMVSLTRVFADVWTTERQINNVRILMSECFCQNLIKCCYCMSFRANCGAIRCYWYRVQYSIGCIGVMGMSIPLWQLIWSGRQKNLYKVGGKQLQVFMA